MRSLVVALVVGCTAPAWAQTGGSGGTGGGTSGLGSCSGSITGSVGLAIPTDTSGVNFTAVQPASIAFVFNFAECACTPPTDLQINLQIKLTQALPLGSQGTVEVWVGSGCDNYTTRTTVNTTACQKITALNINQFTTASTAGANGILVPIPGNALASPVLHQCGQTLASNQIYVFLYTDVMNPFATCTLPLTEDNQGPTAATGVTALSGDSAITLDWTPPAAGSFSPFNYQVLCSDDNGNPVAGLSQTSGYSTCVDGTLQRRPLPSGGSVGTGLDGGVISTDMSLLSARRPITIGTAPVPEQSPIVDMASSDLANTDMLSTTDMAVNPVTFKPLASLDQRFICTAVLASTQSSIRISGLTNNQKYHFVLLGLDQYGNASPSADVVGVPKAVEDLYRRYRDDGGAAGGCFIATAAFGSYESGWVHVLRDFRDQVLLPTSIGHDFVDWYYAHSPPLAGWIASRGWARAIVRVLLLPLIAVAWLWLYTTPWQKAALILLAMAWLMRRRLKAAWRGGNA